jgi:chromosome segregation ATPase
MVDERDATIAFLKAELEKQKRLLTEHYEGRNRLQKRMAAHAAKVTDMNNTIQVLRAELHALKNPGAKFHRKRLNPLRSIV